MLKNTRKPAYLLLAWMLLATLLTVGHIPVAQAAEAANRQQAIDMALQQNGGGKVLGVKTVTNDNGQTVFAIKVLTNGRVRVFRIAKAR